MFQRILVPLDGSKRAERAIPIAARIARASGGSITLLRVVTTAIDTAGHTAESPRLMREVFEVDRARAIDYLATIARLDELAGVETKTEVLFGLSAQTILSAAGPNETDLIIICSHGDTGFKRWVLGSVAEKVARHAPIPVLVVREGGPVPAGPHPDATRPLRALVALDGSALAKAVIEPAAYLIAALAAPAQGALHLTRVVKPVASDSGEKDSAEREQFLYKAKQYLSSTVDHLREGLVAPAVAELKVPVTWSVAVDTDVAAALIRLAENGEDAEGAGVFGGCDIIAMATHGHGGVQRWAMGSITERVLGATKLPLLIVRPPK
ncbi:MAG: universal stress protein [Chloroflexota bacterium]|nr:universal stress protein [Chloroflexota bacterium]